MAIGGVEQGLNLVQLWKDGNFVWVPQNQAYGYQQAGWGYTNRPSAQSTPNVTNNYSPNSGSTQTTPMSTTAPTPSSSGGSSNPFSLTTNTGPVSPVPTNSSPYSGGTSTGSFSVGSPQYSSYTPSYGSGPGGGSSATNFNPYSGVQAGQFSDTRAKYQLGGEAQSDVNAQAQLNTIGQGNPFQQNAQAWANTAGAQAAGQGTALLGQANNMYNSSNTVLNNAFDPQQQLYDKLHQQNTDQSNVLAAQRGITSSPYGARVANEANTNFNIDWQNAQLGRQTQGLQAAGQGNTTGANLGSIGVNQTMQAGQLPYGVGQQGLGNTQQTIQDYLAYLGKGQAASEGNIYIPQSTPHIIQSPFQGYGVTQGQIF